MVSHHTPAVPSVKIVGEVETPTLVSAGKAAPSSSTATTKVPSNETQPPTIAAV